MPDRRAPGKQPERVHDLGVFKAVGMTPAADHHHGDLLGHRPAIIAGLLCGARRQADGRLTGQLLRQIRDDDHPPVIGG
jgi:hypothetical protein